MEKILKFSKIKTEVVNLWYVKQEIYLKQIERNTNISSQNTTVRERHNRRQNVLSAVNNIRLMETEKSTMLIPRITLN